MPISITHTDLIEVGYKFMAKVLRFKIIATEFVAARETPDLIGWFNSYSTLIECKISLSDFKRDKKKYGTRTKKKMGNSRYYLCPEELAHKIIKLDILHDGWGLISVDASLNPRILVEAPFHDDPSYKDEVLMLVSALRRIGCPRITTNLKNYRVVKKIVKDSHKPD